MKRVLYLVGLLAIGAFTFLTTIPVSADGDCPDNATFPNGNDRTKTETVYCTETITSNGTVTQTLTQTQTVTTTLPAITVTLPAITTTVEVTIPAVTMTQTVTLPPETITLPVVTVTLPALTETVMVTLPPATITETQHDTVTLNHTVTNQTTIMQSGQTVTLTTTRVVTETQNGGGTANPYLTFPCPPTYK